MSTMKNLAIAPLLMLSMTAAFGQSQSVRQSGNITQKHASCWVSTGAIGDCGSAAIPFLSSIGTVGQGPTICANSAPSTGPYNQICLSANTGSPAQIVLQNYGGAPAQSIQLNINGAISTIPGISGATVAGNLASFLNGSGVLQDSGIPTSAVTGLGTMAKQNANAVAITGGAITGMPIPSISADVANKQYVDGVAQGLNLLPASTLATAAVLPNSPTYANGTLGVGATLTAGSNTTLTVDATAAPLNTVVLVKNQAVPAQNGIYKVTQAGDGSNPWILTRATYFDIAAQMKAGSYTLITSGSTNDNSSWVMPTAITTVGTDAVTFVQFSAGSLGPAGAVGSFQSNAGGTFGSYAIGQLPGTSTNDSASTGDIGEYVVGTVTSGSAIPLSGTIPFLTPLNVATISLTAGDWDVSGMVAYNNVSGTGTLLFIEADISLASQTVAPAGTTAWNRFSMNEANIGTVGNDIGVPVGPTRISLSVTTTVYLICQIGGTGTPGLKAYGQIQARRVR